ncbi:hypothetical protein [Roseovarius dicentrarchi]|uniref:hypothetical protein n=1 Tax=Roseovarius dicentrarchi TaxID=2250573 RepID=UPI000DEA194D|nr:hypothetical protein [Roseovarius dicentrarchi]
MNLKPALICALLCGTVQPAVAADETTIGAAVSVELNAATEADSGCTLSFLVINGHPLPIEKVVYETVLFDSAGQVDRLTLFDFGALPAARPRVRQFTIPGLACADLGMILINGASTCDAPDLGASACEDGLITGTRTEIEVQG